MPVSHVVTVIIIRTLRTIISHGEGSTFFESQSKQKNYCVVEGRPKSTSCSQSECFIEIFLQERRQNLERRPPLPKNPHRPLYWLRPSLKRAVWGIAASMVSIHVWWKLRTRMTRLTSRFTHKKKSQKKRGWGIVSLYCLKIRSSSSSFNFKSAPLKVVPSICFCLTITDLKSLLQKLSRTEYP